jgi:hypothetical protein
MSSAREGFNTRRQAGISGLADFLGDFAGLLHFPIREQSAGTNLLEEAEWFSAETKINRHDRN